MIKRLPKGKRKSQKKCFMQAKAKLTKADKTKASRELLKKARNLPKKNAQEPAQENAQESEEKKNVSVPFGDDESVRVAKESRLVHKHALPVLLRLGLEHAKLVSPICMVVPKRKIPGMSCKKAYKVLHIDIEKIDAVEMAILRREAELTKKKQPPQEEPITDKDDEDAEEEIRKKQSSEKESFTVVWLLVGGDKNHECQWINAEDVFFL